MKLTEKDRALIENYSKITSGLLFKKGKYQKTKNIRNTCYSAAEFDFDCPQDFAIFDLKRFLDVLSLFKDPDLEFDEKHVVICEADNKKKRIKYLYTNPEYIKTTVEKNVEVNINDSLFSFDLPKDLLSQILKAVSMLGHTKIIFENKDGNLWLKSAGDHSGDSSSEVSVEGLNFDLGPTDVGDFVYILDTYCIYAIPGDYTMAIMEKFFIMQHKESDLLYIMPFNKDSKTIK